jgi:CubicO group peptidase (beta-lactamase class C family)
VTLADLGPRIQATLAGADVPGGVVAVQRDGRPVDLLAVGRDGAGEPLRGDSLLPVASITKLATALAVLRLVDRGKLGLDDPLSRHAPEAAASDPGITLRRLLSHTAGLPIDLPSGAAPYDRSLTWRKLAAACLATAPRQPPNRRVGYSNLGVALLAVAVERATDREFPDACADLVTGPLGIEAYLGAEPPRPVAHVAGVDGRHVGTDLEPFNSPFWRSLALPYGGMVTTAAGALALVQAFRDVPHALVDQTGALAGGLFWPVVWERCPWGLGAELRGQKQPHWAPASAAPSSFGHTGASGCLAWADPEKGIAWSLLAPRTMNNGWMTTACPAVGELILSLAA